MAEATEGTRRYSDIGVYNNTNKLEIQYHKDQRLNKRAKEPEPLQFIRPEPLSNKSDKKEQESDREQGIDVEFEKEDIELEQQQIIKQQNIKKEEIKQKQGIEQEETEQEEKEEEDNQLDTLILTGSYKFKHLSQVEIDSIVTALKEDPEQYSKQLDRQYSLNRNKNINKRKRRSSLRKPINFNQIKQQSINQFGSIRDQVTIGTTTILLPILPAFKITQEIIDKALSKSSLLHFIFSLILFLS